MSHYRSLIAVFIFLLGNALFAAADETKVPRLENAVLRLDLSPENGSMTVLDKRDNLTWRQQAQSGYRVEPGSVRVNPNSLVYRVTNGAESFGLTITIGGNSEPVFDLKVENDKLRYISSPGYPFHFVAPAPNWSYVQNTSGEGVLLPLAGLLRQLGQRHGHVQDLFHAVQ